jgi:hypothetical protein
MVASLGQTGRVEEARPFIVEMEKAAPLQPRLYWDVTNPYVDPAHRTEVSEGLRKAGLHVGDWLG